MPLFLYDAPVPCCPARPLAAVSIQENVGIAAEKYMNSVYRVVWNHSRQTWVAVSELARSAVKRSGASRKRRVSLSIPGVLAIGLMPLNLQAATYTVFDETELRQAILDANASGDASSTIVLGGNVAVSDPTALPASLSPVTIDTGAFTLSVPTVTGNVPGLALTLGDGAVSLTGNLQAGDAAVADNRMAGGSLAKTGGTIDNQGTVTGGRGGSTARSSPVGRVTGEGGSGMSLTNVALRNDGTIVGGAGGLYDGEMATGGNTNSNMGAGGAGVSMVGGTLNNRGTITGGAGGTSFNVPATVDNVFAGAGGVGASLSGGTHSNTGTILGGLAGEGMNAGASGHGTGGNGVALTAGATLVNSGIVMARDGRAGGGTVIGTGSAGGVGVTVANSVLQNEATGWITGGDGGGTVSTGGVAIQGTGGATVINSGTIIAGISGNGTRVNAVQFTGGTNVFELRTGSNITGNVVGTAGDTFALGGTTTDTFGVAQIGAAAQYRGFTNYQKRGTGTWTLTGTTALATPWDLREGTLSVSANTNLGAAAGALIFNGGTLQITGTTFTALTRTIQWNAAGGGLDIADAANTVTLAQSLAGGGPLTKRGAGTLTMTGTNSYAGGTTIEAGTLRLGNGGTTGSIVGDVANNGTLEFNRSDDVTFAGVISGTGAVNKQGAGTTILTGANSYTGTTDIAAGTLVVNGNQSAATGAVTVRNGTTLAGSGVLGGAVTVQNGGSLSPGNSPGTLTMGALTLNTGSTLNFELGVPNVVGGALNDLIVANGNLTLDGTLNVAETPGGAFDVGVYRIISYNGTLTDNTLDLGTLPAAADPTKVYVQTAVPNQVNLVNSTGLTMRFWDGQNATGHNNGGFDGANGVWSAAGGNVNWTASVPVANNRWEDNAFAVFGGTGGTVTVDNSAGPVNFSGAQFMVDGYALQGPGTLTTTTADTVIRVGDGTALGETMTATLNAPIAGTGGLVKTDRGTLVLGGVNSYTGGTRIEAGVLQIGTDANLGAASGGLALDGGTLRLGQDLELTRGISVLAGGGAIDTQTYTGTLSGTWSGAADWSKLGAGTLVLAATNTTTGTGTVTAGTLRAGATDALGTAASYAVNAGATLDLAGFNQTISGLTNAGTVSLRGATPGTTLTVQGNYVGNNGVLQLGTVLGDNASATDRLVIDGGSATGNTTVQVTNVGGLGAQTSGNGIELISAINGATTTAQTTRDAFALAGGHVDAGAFEYRLHAGDAAGAGENWYLRSTLVPTQQPGDPANPGAGAPVAYRPEVALRAALPAMLAQSDQAMLGTLHQRVGDNAALSGTASGEGNRGWARYINQDVKNRQDGTVSPSSDGWSRGVQAGLDLLRQTDHRIGVYGGHLEWNSDVSGFASGRQNLGVGNLRGHSDYAGVYWTYTGDSGWYSDVVLQQGWQRGTARAHSGASSDIRGSSTAGSIELGKSLPISKHWGVEPQVQLIVARQRLKDQSIPAAQFYQDNVTTTTGRLGVRLVGDYETARGRVRPYGRVNVWHGFNGSDNMSVGGPGGSANITTERGYTSTDIALGATWTINDRFSLYGEAGHMFALGGSQRVRASNVVSAGVRVAW